MKTETKPNCGPIAGLDLFHTSTAIESRFCWKVYFSSGPGDKRNDMGLARINTIDILELAVPCEFNQITPVVRQGAGESIREIRYFTVQWCEGNGNINHGGLFDTVLQRRVEIPPEATDVFDASYIKGTKNPMILIQVGIKGGGQRLCLLDEGETHAILL